MKEPVIVNAVRTAQGRFGGSLKNVDVTQLGKTVIKGVLEEAGLRPVVSEEQKNLRPSKFRDIEKCSIEEKYMDWDDDSKGIELDEVIMGNVLQGGQGQNTCRQASIKAGIPREVPEFTVNKVCASGTKAITLAARKIEIGHADAIIAGGMENMSSAPYVLPKARWGYRMDIDGKAEARDMMVWDGLYEIFYDYHMGITAENLAEAYDISKEEQDRMSVESYNRALEAIEKGIFDEEIIPVEISKKGETKYFNQDECPRETSLETMSKLPPVFKKDGTVTAGNASSVSDGSAALLVTSREFAEENNLKIRASIKGYESGAVDPQYMGLGPVPATEKLMDELEYELEDIDAIEENEAFAAQTLAVMTESEMPKYGIDMNEEGSEIINPHGSGISLGHPIGCTGARLIVTLLHELERKDGSVGLSSLCVGGGMGMAIAIER